MNEDASAGALEAYGRARDLLDGPLVALCLGDTTSAIAIGAGPRPERLLTVELGVGSIQARHFHGGVPDGAGVEAAIAAVEDAIMPLLRVMPGAARLVSADPRIAAVAGFGGLADHGGSTLGIDAVERLFDRWTARVLGRPASQDPMPVSGDFAATLLILRETLHHLKFHGITLLPPPGPDGSPHP